MDYQQYCNHLRKNYQPLHPHLYTMRAEYFAPSLVQAVRAGTPESLRRIVREVHPQVYVFDMLRPTFCTELLAEATVWFEEWCQQNQLPQIRPNTMNNYGTVLDTIGFAPFLHQLMETYITPFAALLYPDVGGATLDNHHGFLVEYQVGKDTSLDFHVDASDVTLNVCLGKEFTGGTLFFRGVRCEQHQETAWHPHEEFEMAHTSGQAILHRGRHRHGANPILSGARHNLIVWCNSSRFDRDFDRKRCPPWCGGSGPET